MPDAVAWFLNDANGVQIARSPERDSSGDYYHTIGTYYGWRSYFHGGPADKVETWVPSAGEHVQKTHLSDVFISQAINRWVVSVSAPVYSRDDPENARFLGVVSLLVEVGRFAEWEEKGKHQKAVLVDWRDGSNKGLILQDPDMDDLLDKQQVAPDFLKDLKVDVEKIKDIPCQLTNYLDPLAQQANGKEQRWLAHFEPVDARDQPTGLAVIVQEEYSQGIGGALAKLEQRMLSYGVLALGIIVTLMIGLWAFAIRLYGGRAATHPPDAADSEIDISPGDSNVSATPGSDRESPTEPLN
jgi:hypothetical protein